jgi:nucleoid-associated protein YgaU
MSYRLANSLKKLRDQINAAKPNRSKASDGWIGDAAHASRNSDHNPWVKLKGEGIVTAIDITHDPKTGVDCNQLAKEIFESHDPRIKYLIWNKQITKPGLSGWKPYTGINAHQHHLHISVNSDPKLFDSETEWHFELGETASGENSGVSEEYYTVRSGDTLWAIAKSYGTTISRLQELNGIDGDLIRPGQKLRVK